PAAAARNILVCNVPDYGTTEVADHAMALALALRRGVILYHERQRQSPPAAWGPVKGELVRRFGVQTLGILRAATLEDLLRQTDTLSIHTPLTPETRGMIGHAQLALLRKGAVAVN